MTDYNVSVNFSASTGDFESGVAGAREALASLAAPIAAINEKYAALGAALAESHTRALQAIKTGDNAAYADSLRAAQEALSDKIKLEQGGLKDKLASYRQDADNHRLSEQEKLQASREAVEQAYAVELDLMNRKRELAGASLAQRQRIDIEIAAMERGEQRELTQLTRAALDEQASSYAFFAETVTRSFDKQWQGLLSGTQTWRDALRKTLGELLINFIEWGEGTAIRWVAVEAAKTQATAAGVAARTGLQQAGESAALASQGASVVRSILSSAAEAFAGVFGFLAPVMGPFAAGPAAAAQATVAGAAASVASADIGMWSAPADMLTLVHHNELIMPAAQAGAFRDLLSTPSANAAAAAAPLSIAPTTHFHINALDGDSVSQWMRSNASQMLRAVDEAVRHGAHLGLRRVARP